ncbi:MAG: hypothetical protein ACJAYD_001053 [Patiriisocius sp.]|jgi:hypothetical protein
MKKLLYLLLAITFIGCSSDDNSNEEPANQLFLDIYDGVVWQIEQPTGDYFSDKLTFYSDPSSISAFSFGSCDTVIFGEPYPFTDDGVVIGEVTYSIQNEGQNSIVIFNQFVDNDGNLSPETRTITCTVSSGGNTLLLEQFFSGDGEQEADTYIIAPDEFPCN